MENIMEKVSEYKKHLANEEYSSRTINMYIKNIEVFIDWLEGRELEKEVVIEFKTYLSSQGFSHTTINAKLSALNGFFKFLGCEGCCVKFLKVQRMMFREESKDLTKSEYEKLINTAYNKGNERLALIMQTICSTGIRVSELQYITVETVKNGKVEIYLKGKCRVILIPKALKKKLLSYATQQQIKNSELFITKNGNPLNRRQIWREMKSICEEANVKESKVFPHNLRHLFATTFYNISKDIVKLADILGHSSVNTTRIYLISTGNEHLKAIDKLHLVC